MALAILSTEIRHERDTVNARQRARQVSRLLGFDLQDQTRISTAVSEIARNAYNYAKGGRIEFLIESKTRPQLFIIKVTDAGAGVPNLPAIFEGRYESKTGMGLGIIGAKRLMDRFHIDTVAGVGTTVEMTKLIPRHAPLISQEDVGRIAGELARERPHDPFQELQYQNQELLRALEEIRARQMELTQLNRELEDTNRGVVALYAELDEKADHLRRADELKSKFLSNMSHEFRSPLNSILALSSLLRDRSDGPLTGEQEQQVGYIRKAAQDLLELVNDLLDLAKVEAGKLEARPIEFEIAKLFATLRGMLRPLLLNQSLELIFDDVSHIPPLFTDEGKVSQILRNFISNALKFTEKGEVRVSAQLVGGKEVTVSVTDTGIGIPVEDQELIFQDFVQLDHPIQRKVKGTGLGLPLSKKLASFLGGTVEVTSELGCGSTFTLRIPRTYQSKVLSASAPAAGATADSVGPPVLFVEDSPETLMAYRAYLRDSGFQLISASTIREAEVLLQKIEPCAIVLDILLRGEDSWGFMASLKMDESTRKIPIIVASTNEDQAKGFHLGADAYLVKPVERADLLKQLRALTAVPALARILIIDDNQLDRYLLKQQLKDKPVAIMEASGGADGVVRANENPPDLIFLDLTMPDMTGYDVIEELRRSRATRDIPVVIVTSQALTGSETQKLSQQCAAIINKGELNESAGGEAIRRTLEELSQGTKWQR